MVGLAVNRQDATSSSLLVDEYAMVGLAIHLQDATPSSLLVHGCV